MSDLVERLYGLANDADNWADSYEGQRQGRWLARMAGGFREAAAEIERLREQADIDAQAVGMSDIERPTNAQIEAAARAFFENMSDIDGDEADWILLRDDCLLGAKAALTAAAAIEDTTDIIADIANKRAAIAATIERCEQVVRRFLIAPDADIEADRKVRKIIDAIRALP